MLKVRILRSKDRVQHSDFKGSGVKPQRSKFGSQISEFRGQNSEFRGESTGSKVRVLISKVKSGEF